MSDATDRPSDRLVPARPETDSPDADEVNTQPPSTEPLDTDNVEASVLQGEAVGPREEFDPETPGVPAPGAESGPLADPS